jgi:transcriptional regulator with XRE-family HTH domain
VANAGGPTAARRRLGNELRNLRLKTGRTAENAAQALDCSQSKISRLEAGKGIPRARDVRDLLDLYGVKGAAKRKELTDLATRGQARGWWESYRDIEIPDHLKRLITLEEDVQTYLSFEPDFVPGLLQAPSYIEEVIGTGGLDPFDAKRRVEFRLERQAVFYKRSSNPRFEVVLGQSALDLSFVSPSALGEQIEELKRRVDAGLVELRILPSDVVSRAALGGPLLVMQFSAGEEDLVYLESREGGQYIESPAVVQRYLGTFAAIREKAMSAVESRDWLEKLTVG